MRNTTTAPLKGAGKLLKISDKRDRLLFACALFLGLRSNELVKLKWEDVVGKDEILVFQSKTKKKRSIFVHPQLKEIINDCYEGQEGLMFTGRRGQSGDRPLTNAGVNFILRRHLKILGITSSKNDSSHALRKSFADSYFSSNGRNFDSLLWLSKQLGHSSVQITLRYIGQDDLMQAQNIKNIQY